MARSVPLASPQSRIAARRLYHSASRVTFFGLISVRYHSGKHRGGMKGRVERA
jgi:hypothetical protein